MNKAKAFRAQYRYFCSLRDEANSRMAETAELRSYRLTYARSMKALFKSAKSIEHSRFAKLINKKRFVFVGDHHAYPQSQRQILHYLSQLDTKAHQQVTLILEAFLPEHDVYLEKFLKDKISLLELRQKTRFDQQWGFDWRPYGDILRYAKDHRFHVCGLDRSSPRDSKLAMHILRISSQRSHGKYFVLLGEHHLSPEHTPLDFESLTSSKDTLYIHQNSDDFDLLRLKSYKVSAYESIYQLNPKHTYKTSGTPWSRFSSALRWLDGDLSETLPDADSEKTPWYELLHRVSHDFAALLGTHPLDLDGISVKTALRPPNYDENSLLRFALENGLCLILEHRKNESEIFVPYYSENYAYELLGRLYYRRGKPIFIKSYQELLYEHIAGHMVGYLWNPTRKPLPSLTLSHKNSKEHNLYLEIALRWRDSLMGLREPLKNGIFDLWFDAWLKKNRKLLPKKFQPFIVHYLSSYLGAEGLAKRALDRIQDNRLRPVDILESLFLGTRPVPASWFKPRRNETSELTS